MSRLPTLTVSIVSHGQAALAGHVMRDLERCTAVPLEVVLTVNVPEQLPFDPHGFSYPVTVLENCTPKGFGANHNAAFRVARGEHFCVMNPDIRLTGDPYPGLISQLSDARVGVAGPAVKNPAGYMEDSARRFPTLWTLVRKAFIKGTHLDYALDRLPLEPDWLAGMFMLFRTSTFRRIGGFDERYFLYYEDVDLCMRLRAAGYRVVWEPGVPVVHEARRTSRRNLRYLSWHLRSILRYLLVSRRRARTVA
jgi:N-acetylglucosaminyl-diphospho-decaprenol L-rhamnosyltransferase